MSPNVTNRQLVAVAALVRGDTVDRAASAAGVTRRTVLRWKDQPAFRDAVRSGRVAAFEQTLAAIEAGAAEAVGVLRRQMKAQKGAAHKTAAARAVLAVALRAHESLEIEERLSALERRMR